MVGVFIYERKRAHCGLAGFYSRSKELMPTRFCGVDRTASGSKSVRNKVGSNRDAVMSAGFLDNKSEKSANNFYFPLVHFLFEFLTPLRLLFMINHFAKLCLIMKGKNLKNVSYGIYQFSPKSAWKTHLLRYKSRSGWNAKSPPLKKDLFCFN